MNIEDRKFKRNYIIGLTIVALLTGWGGAALIKGCLPEHYVEWFPFMPLFFYIWGLIFIALFRRESRRVAWLFLGMKVAKMLLFVLICGLYIALSDTQKTDFVVTFLILYIIFMIFETVFFWYYEKKRKIKNNEDE